MENIDIVEKLCYDGFGYISTTEAIINCEERPNFQFVRFKHYYLNGEESETFSLDQEKVLNLGFNTSIHDDNVELFAFPDPTVRKSVFCFSVSKILKKCKHLKKNKNDYYNWTEIEGKARYFLNFDNCKNLYINCIFSPMNFPIVRIFKIKNGIEIDPNIIYFEPKNTPFGSVENIAVTTEIYSDIFGKIFDSRIWHGFISAQKTEKNIIKSQKRISTVNELDIFLANNG